MVDYAIRPVWLSNVFSWHRQKVIDPVENFVRQVEDRTDKSARRLGELEVPGEQIDQKNDATRFETTVDWLYESGYIRDGDMVLIGHDHWAHGLGQSHAPYSPSNAPDDVRVVGGCVYIGLFVTHAVARNIGIHELGHQEPFDCGCGDGEVVVENDEVARISPMSTSYVHNSDGECDTGSAGSFICGGRAEGPFCNGTKQETHPFADGQLHEPELGSCFVQAIENDEGAFSSR